MERTHKVLQGFFWVAFASFLGASIPHVAYFFRAYEPMGDDTPWWIVSYAIAISIDVTIFLLSVTVAGLQRQKKSAALILSVWVFIVGLALVSWYINWLYAAHFVDSSMISSTPVTLPFIGRIADINPLIASCFQVLAIAYTWISDKIAKAETVKTAAQLQQEADELEAIAIQQQRIAAIKRGSRVSAVKALINAGSEVASHLKQSVTLTVSTSQAPETKLESTPVSSLPQTEAEIEAEPQRVPVEPEQVSTEPLETANIGMMVQQFIEAERAKGHEPTLADIMKQTGCSKATASRYRNRAETVAQLRIV
jgi:uncharacterized membrane protein